MLVAIVVALVGFWVWRKFDAWLDSLFADGGGFAWLNDQEWVVAIRVLEGIW